MDGLMGVVGEDFTIIATDKTQARSIMVFKQDMDKTCNIDDHKVLGLGGPQADRKVFGEYCQKNLKLYALRNGIDLSNDAAAHWVRNQLAQSLRSRSPYQVSVLLGGHDAEGPALYWMDYLGSIRKVGYGAHGISSNFAYAIMDKNWKKGMTRDEAKALLLSCIQQLALRVIVSQPKWVFKIIDKDGIHEEEIDAPKARTFAIEEGAMQ